jgi:hypothetical protein
MALILLLTALLVTLLYGVMHEAIAAWLAHVYGTVRSYYLMIPQPVLWMVCIGLGVMIALKSLLLNGKWSLEGRKPPASRGRVQTIRLWIRQAATEVYFDRRLALHLGKLAVEIQSHTSGHQISPGPVRQRLESLDLPPHIREYLQSGLEPLAAGRAEPSGLGWLARWFRPPVTRSAPDTDLEEIVRLLEDQLEVRHDADQRDH